MVGLRWLLSLLRTCRPCDAQRTVLAQVRELLDKGANIEAVVGSTALNIAAEKGYDAVVREPPGPGRREGQWDPNPNFRSQRSRGFVSFSVWIRRNGV